MRDTLQLEEYLLGTSGAEENLLMEAKLILYPDLREKMEWQKQTYTLVKNYGRKSLKAEIQAVEQKLFTEEKFLSFREKISAIFKREP